MKWTPIPAKSSGTLSRTQRAERSARGDAEAVTVGCSRQPSALPPTRQRQHATSTSCTSLFGGPLITLTEEDLRQIGLWAADCAERVLPLFEAKAPADARPREAVEGIRAFGHGGKRTAHLRSLALAALAAAREVADQAAAAAARAAGLAASSAFMHAKYSPQQEKHALGPAAYAARTRELAAADDPGAGDDEIGWAIEHASQAVREVVRRLPARAPGRGRLDALMHQLDAGLRS